MLYKKSEILGFFIPSFFHLSIDTSANSLQEISLSERITYLHEYIHFLQDITTGFGISRLIFSFKQFANIFSNVNSYQSFKECAEHYWHKLETNEAEMEEHDDFFYESDYISSDTKNYGKLIGCTPHYELNIVSLAFENLIDTSLPIHCNFTAAYIEEFMAFLIENTIFPTDKDIPRFPYKIVSEVIDFVYPNCLSNEQIIELCDLALQSTNPGIDFIILLNRIKNGESVDILWNDTLDVRDRIDGSVKETYTASLSCKNVINSDKFLELKDSCFSGELRSPIYEYIEELCMKGSDYRFNKKQKLFSELLSLDSKSIFNKIIELHKIIGAPNIFRSKDSYYLGAFAQQQSGASFLPILNTLLKHSLYNNELTCPYYSLCKNEGEKYNAQYNENCKENFILNIKDSGQLCLATGLAKSMGITKNLK